MASAALTPGELIARLKQVTGTHTDAKLAHELSLYLDEVVPERYVAHWKKGKGPQWATAVRLLDLAGWLCPDGQADDRARTRRVESLAQRAEAALGELRALREP